MSARLPRSVPRAGGKSVPQCTGLSFPQPDGQALLMVTVRRCKGTEGSWLPPVSSLSFSKEAPLDPDGLQASAFPKAVVKGSYSSVQGVNLGLRKLVLQ